MGHLIAWAGFLRHLFSRLDARFMEKIFKLPHHTWINDDAWIGWAMNLWACSQKWPSGQIISMLRYWDDLPIASTCFLWGSVDLQMFNFRRLMQESIGILALSVRLPVQDVPGAAPNAWPRLTETYSKISEIDVWNRRIDPNRQSNNARVRFGYVRMMCLQKWITHKHSSGGNLASLRHASAWRFLTGLRYLQERCFCPCARRTATGTVLIADIYQSCTIWFARSWCPKRLTNERERESVWARNLVVWYFFAGVPWAQQSFIAIHCQCFCRSAWAPCACRPQSVQWFAALTCKCCFILGNPPGCPSKKNIDCYPLVI